MLSRHIASTSQPPTIDYDTFEMLLHNYAELRGLQHHDVMRCFEHVSHEYHATHDYFKIMQLIFYYMNGENMRLVQTGQRPKGMTVMTVHDPRTITEDSLKTLATLPDYQQGARITQKGNIVHVQPPQQIGRRGDRISLPPKVFLSFFEGYTQETLNSLSSEEVAAIFLSVLETRRDEFPQLDHIDTVEGVMQHISVEGMDSMDGGVDGGVGRGGVLGGVSEQFDNVDDIPEVLLEYLLQATMSHPQQRNNPLFEGWKTTDDVKKTLKQMRSHAPKGVGRGAGPSGTREIHVREVISTLGSIKDYKSLMPSFALFTQPTLGKNVQAFKPKKFGIKDWEYGLVMEDIIHTILTTKSAKGVINTVPEGKRHLFKEEDYAPLVELLHKHFKNPKHYIREVEWRCAGVVGHPDVVYKNCVYDVKTTHSFSGMRKETIYQLLCYYCLAQLNPPPPAGGGGSDGAESHNLPRVPITHVGLIAPLQLEVIKYDLTGWDWKGWWDMVVKHLADRDSGKGLNKLSGTEGADPKNPKKGDCFINKQGTAEDVATLQRLRHYIGATVYKTDLHNSIYSNPRIPYQFFLYGNQKAYGKRNASFNNKTRQLIAQHNAQVYMHLPYSLNLSKPDLNARETDDPNFPWTCRVIVDYLREAEEMGVRGCVIHCGRLGHTPIGYDEAIETMINSIKLVLDTFTNESPVKLIIETSSGQGGETVTSPQEYIEFYNRFEPRYQQRLGICVDTCHVFASGHMPVDYFNHLDRAGLTVDLVHFNDSFEPFGSMRDRHARFGEGCIGAKQLLEVLKLCHQRQIPMVTE